VTPGFKVNIFSHSNRRERFLELENILFGKCEEEGHVEMEKAEEVNV
jgi:hypothetical protein